MPRGHNNLFTIFLNPKRKKNYRFTISPLERIKSHFIFHVQNDRVQKIYNFLVCGNKRCNCVSVHVYGPEWISKEEKKYKHSLTSSYRFTLPTQRKTQKFEFFLYSYSNQLLFICLRQRSRWTKEMASWNLGSRILYPLHLNRKI